MTLDRSLRYRHNIRNLLDGHFFQMKKRQDSPRKRWEAVNLMHNGSRHISRFVLPVRTGRFIGKAAGGNIVFAADYIIEQW